GDRFRRSRSAQHRFPAHRHDHGVGGRPGGRRPRRVRSRREVGRMSWPAMSIAAAHAELTRPGAPFETGDAVVGGIPRRVWRCGPATALDLLATARSHGDRTFLVHEADRVTFLAFHKAVAAFARELRAAGTAPGDRVAIALRNRPEWPAVFFAAI